MPVWTAIRRRRLVGVLDHLPRAGPHTKAKRLLVPRGANAAFRGGWAVLLLLPFVLLPVLSLYWDIGCEVGLRHRHRSDDPPPIPQRLAKVLLLLLEQPGERLVAVLLAVAEAARLPPRLRMRRPRVPLLVLRWAVVEHALGGGGREDAELLLLLLLLRLQLAAQTSARFGARTAARVRRGG